MRRKQYIYLLGAPGSGKGTQGQRLGSVLGIPSISTGELLREMRARGGPLGSQLTQWMDRGQLVPNEVVMGLIEQRLQQNDCQQGAIFDGFPRNLVQAQALDALLTKMDSTPLRVILLDVPEVELQQRLSGRLVCPVCHRSYHRVQYPPAREGVCDTCGTSLVTRSDDLPETISHRLRTYHEQTAPLIEYYDKQGSLQKVEGVGPVEDVFASLLTAATRA